MSQLDLIKLASDLKKSRKLRNVILTERDLEIIEFLLDMKFASVQDVFEKFFKITLSGEAAKSREWAVRRLQQLEKAGYIKGVHSFSERTKFYLGTIKGYYAVSESKPEESITKPVQAIDHRTFSHDRFVLESRIALENQRAATCWISDRKLRSSKELSGGLEHGNVPDGIYVSQDNQRVALEIEMSVKSKSDYSKKIAQYVSMMRSANSNIRVFDKVLYVCAKVHSYEYLIKETKIYGNLFEIKRMSEFFNQLSSSLSSEK